MAEQKAMNEQQTKLAQKTKKLRNYRAKSKTLIQRKNWPRKRLNRQAIRPLLAKDKEVQALENQLATLRLKHENQLQKTLSDLEKRTGSGQKSAP